MVNHPNRAYRDGLKGNWAADVRALNPDGAVWMNPPYGRGLEAWMAEARATAATGVTVRCLVPARTETKWFHEHVQRSGVVRSKRPGARSSRKPFTSFSLSDIALDVWSVGDLRIQAIPAIPYLQETRAV